jgi:hypothetical protein
MFETVYIVKAGPPPGMFLLLGSALLMAYIGRRLRVSSPRRLILIIWACLTGPISVLMIVHSFVSSNAAVQAYRRGEYEVLEGDVRVLRTQSADGRGPADLVELAGRTLEVDATRDAPGYARTVAHGGGLRNGVRARVYINDGAILRVDIWRPNQP